MALSTVSDANITQLLQMMIQEIKTRGIDIKPLIEGGSISKSGKKKDPKQASKASPKKASKKMNSIDTTTFLKNKIMRLKLDVPSEVSPLVRTDVIPKKWHMPVTFFLHLKDNAGTDKRKWVSSNRFQTEFIRAVYHQQHPRRTKWNSIRKEDKIGMAEDEFTGYFFEIKVGQPMHI